MRSLLLSIDRRMHRELIRPLPTVHAFMLAMIWVTSATRVLDVVIDPVWTDVIFVSAPALVGIALWIRVGRSLAGALAWGIPFTIYNAAVMVFTVEPIRTVAYVSAIALWFLFVGSSRIADSIEARLVGLAPPGRLESDDQDFDDSLENVLADALAYGSQFERGTISADSLRAGLLEGRARASHLKPPHDAWMETHRALLTLLDSLIEIARHPTAEPTEEDRDRVSELMAEYQRLRTAVRAGRIRPWRGFELFE